MRAPPHPENMNEGVVNDVIVRSLFLGELTKDTACGYVERALTLSNLSLTSKYLHRNITTLMRSSTLRRDDPAFLRLCFVTYVCARDDGRLLQNQLTHMEPGAPWRSNVRRLTDTGSFITDVFFHGAFDVLITFFCDHKIFEDDLPCGACDAASYRIKLERQNDFIHYAARHTDSYFMRIALHLKPRCASNHHHLLRTDGKRTSWNCKPCMGSVPDELSRAGNAVTLRYLVEETGWWHNRLRAFAHQTGEFGDLIRQYMAVRAGHARNRGHVS